MSAAPYSQSLGEHRILKEVHTLVEIGLELRITTVCSKGFTLRLILQTPICTALLVEAGKGGAYMFKWTT